jgi:predicted dienelactone hydrolase
MGQFLRGGERHSRGAGPFRRAGTLLLTILITSVTACAAPVRGDAPPPPPGAQLVAPPADPLRPGPYPVGTITRTLERRSSTTGEPRMLDVVIWYPASEMTRLFLPDQRLRAVPGAPVAAGGPFAVVLFSHGAGSSPIQSTFLTAHLASHGFVVAAPSHPGTTVDDCLGCGSPERQQAMIRDSAANRPDDVTFVLDALTAMNGDQRSVLAGALDTVHAGVIGHSWGGYTAVVAAEADRRFRAAIAMAPVVNDTLEETAQRLRTPVLVMGSRLDNITPFPAQERLFARLPAGTPRFLLTFPLGGHTAYSEVCPDATPGCRPGELADNAHPLVNAFAVAFLRVYLLGDSRYAGMLSPASGGTLLEFIARDGPH